MVATGMENFLKPTRYLDFNSASIQSLAQQLLASHGGAADSETNKTALAVHIHDYVRDNIAFGFPPFFWDECASSVLKSGRGFCNTKSTLFVALLRAVGIPARQHFVSINTQVLIGIVDPRTKFVDHSFAEVFLDGKWVRTDSYIVDKKLFDSARERLEKEGLWLGYGVSKSGTCHWDGATDAYSQFCLHGQRSEGTVLSDRDFGVFDDVGEFYAKARGTNNSGWIPKMVFYFFSKSVNSSIDVIRDSK